jgi:dTDP-4-dehydrorhamnose 3,5-epimerase-like enzyme
MSLIEKIQILDLKSFIDDRGELVQLFDQDFKIVRAYVVGNFDKNTVRGFHKNLEEWKYFYVVKGSVKFVIVENENNIKTIILSVKKPQLLIIPPNLWNGWKALEDDSLLLGFSNRVMTNHKDERLDPYAFGKDIWEVKNR